MTATPLPHHPTQQVLDGWADLSDDHNPLHVDPDVGARSRFGSTIAHGHMTIAWMTAAATARLGVDAMIGRRLADVRFTAPVLPGHHYGVRCTPVDGHTLRLVVHDRDGQPCATATLEPTHPEGPPT